MIKVLIILFKTGIICDERAVDRMIERPRYLNRIVPFIDAPFVKVLTGVRRAGKSTIMAMLRDELIKRGIPDKRILSYRFDSLRYDGIKTAKKLYEEVSGKLPEGQTASEKAVAIAESLGYSLAPDETYVCPFERASWITRINR